MQAAIMVPGPQGGHWDIREVQRPTVPPGHVLLRVRASSINRAEFRRLHNLRTQPGQPAPEEMPAPRVPSDVPVSSAPSKPPMGFAQRTE